MLLAVLLLGVRGEDDVDHYETLGLGQERDEAAERDIKAAWRKLSKQYHPDLAGETSREYYQRIQRAYEVLGDRKKRKIYDIRGEDGVKQMERPDQGQGAMDPFLQMFGFGGGGGGGGNNKVNRGQNVHMVMMVTLEDLYNGAAHTVKLSKQKICKKCRGTGAATKADYVVCNECRGSGQTIERVQLFPGFEQQVQGVCKKCSGKGKMVGKKCDTCNGKKVLRGEHTLGVDIEQGTPDNFELVYEMEGDQNPEEIPGDVVFVISSKAHDTFTRTGSDLTMKLTLSLSEALLGFVKTIVHMDGHDLEVHEDDPVQYGQVKRVKGEGMPVHHVPSEKGDLLITYEIEMPSMLTGDQRTKIEQLFP